MEGKISLHDFFIIVSNTDDLMEFLYKHKTLRRSLMCPDCGKECILDNNIFVCNETLIVNEEEMRHSTFSASLFEGTWFSKDSVHLQDICIFTAFWAVMPYPRSKFLMEQLGWSLKNVLKWLRFCRELCVAWVYDTQKAMGGDGKIVEISAIEICKKKLKNGRLIKGFWIFGGLERGTTNMFLELVKNKSKNTFLAILNKWVLPGTTIMSDNTESYDGLENDGYRHFTVNHRIHFVDPTTGAHTQNIERIWRDFRGNLPWYVITKKQHVAFLAEFLWKKSVPDFKDRINSVFHDLIARKYNPYQKITEKPESVNLKMDVVSSLNIRYGG